MRVDKDTYYLNIAKAVAARSTCLTWQFGAVIVANDEIIAAGYNGAPKGETNCCDTGICTHSKTGSCIAVHAEQNAIISAARRDMQGATLYLANLNDITEPAPCNVCDRMIKAAGITRVVTKVPND